MQKILVINPGSTSKKYAYYQDQTELISIHIEVVDEQYVAHVRIQDRIGDIPISTGDFDNPHKHIFELLIAEGFITHENDIDRFAIRVVAPGTFFLNDKCIDEKYIDALKEIVGVVPLHIKPVLEEIKSLKNYGITTQIWGISDSRFHSTIPDYVRRYALPQNSITKHDIQKFGYHGISIQSVGGTITQILGSMPSKVIVCHLGGGASVTALLDGKSIETSMGYSPLEGLIMATRVGDIDAGALITYAKKENIDLDSLEEILNKDSGLLGLSNTSSDIRNLLEIESENEFARIALMSYVHRIQKYIGAYTAILNGIDMIVFAGTVGERSFIMRERICKNLTYLGLEIDYNLNKNIISKNSFIQSNNSKVQIAIIVTDENGEIAKTVSSYI